MNISLDQVLSQLRKDFPNHSVRGKRFERLMANYLRKSPLYENEFQSVKSWSDWAGQNQLDRRDLGIDIVAEGENGELTAVQCKFYKEDPGVSKKNINSFFAESGRSHNGKRFSHRIIITTTNKWSENATKDHHRPRP